jgi:ankyrin repeat protein
VNAPFSHTTPLNRAISSGYRSIVELLIRAGAQVDQAAPDGLLPLAVARRQSRTNATAAEREQIIDLLIKARLPPPSLLLHLCVFVQIHSLLAIIVLSAEAWERAPMPPFNSASPHLSQHPADHGGAIDHAGCAVARAQLADLALAAVDPDRRLSPREDPAPLPQRGR